MAELVIRACEICGCKPSELGDDLVDIARYLSIIGRAYNPQDDQDSAPGGSTVGDQYQAAAVAHAAELANRGAGRGVA